MVWKHPCSHKYYLNSNIFYISTLKSPFLITLHLMCCIDGEIECNTEFLSKMSPREHQRKIHTGYRVTLLEIFGNRKKSMGHPPNHQSGWLEVMLGLILIYSYKLCALSKSFVCLKIRAKYLNIQNSTEAWWSSKTKYMRKDIRDPNLIIPFNKHEHEMPALANGIILYI